MADSSKSQKSSESSANSSNDRKADRDNAGSIYRESDSPIPGSFEEVSPEEQRENNSK